MKTIVSKFSMGFSILVLILSIATFAIPNEDSKAKGYAEYTEEAYLKVMKQNNCFAGFDNKGAEVHDCSLLIKK